MAGMKTDLLYESAQRTAAKLGWQWRPSEFEGWALIEGEGHVLEFASNEWHLSRKSPQMWIQPILDLRGGFLDSAPQLNIGVRNAQVPRMIREWMPKWDAFAEKIAAKQPQLTALEQWLASLDERWPDAHETAQGRWWRGVHLSARDDKDQVELSFQRITQQQAEGVLEAYFSSPIPVQVEGYEHEVRGTKWARIEASEWVPESG